MECANARAAWAGAAARVAPAPGGSAASLGLVSSSESPPAIDTSAGEVSQADHPPAGPSASNAARVAYLCGLVTRQPCGVCELVVSAFSCQNAAKMAGCSPLTTVAAASGISGSGLLGKGIAGSLASLAVAD